jgi:RNA polymerase sigma-70 factor (ECF subfamily)
MMNNRIAKSPCFDGRRQTDPSRDWEYVSEVERGQPTNNGFGAEILIFCKIVSRLPIGPRDSFYFHVGERETLVHTRGDNTASDAELVRQAGNGRPDAYGELARRWSPCVMAVCHARVRCQTSAADLAQETLLRGFRDLVTLKSPEKFGAWLRGIAHRVCLDWLKSKQRSQVPFSRLASDGHPCELLAASNDVGAAVDQLDELNRLMVEIESLSDNHREALMLFYYGEMSYRDMAELLGVSAATINARLSEARELLRERLGTSRRETHEL